MTCTVSLPRLLIAAPSSGSGKTTIACGLLQLAKQAGMRPHGFKCGPDYIDPMFHRRLLGVPSTNLDLFFSGEEEICRLLAVRSQGHGIAVMEGVMGLYDGVRGTERASSYHLAKATQTPILLVVRAQGAALTLAASIQGLARFRPGGLIGGVILNGCSASLYAFLRPILQRETGIPVLGYLPNLPDAVLQSRHLGLTTPDGIAEIEEKLALIAEEMQRCVDLAGIWALAEGAQPLTYQPEPEHLPPVPTAKIAVARDEAFSFYYEENLTLLEQAGAQLEFFSPLRAKHLPDGCCGLYLGGGYPELWAAQLSKNETLRQEICALGNAGLPILGECGGFLYLQDTLEDPSGNAWPMVGLLHGRGYPTGRLCRFGYRSLTPRGAQPYLMEGEEILGHEFHYWDCDRLGDACLSRRPSAANGTGCCVAEKNIFAGFPHLYFPSCPAFGQRFVAACAAYGRGERFDP